MTRTKRPYPCGATMDRLADELADNGGSVAEAAVKLGLSYAYANAVFQRMRKRLGGQAR